MATKRSTRAVKRGNGIKDLSVKSGQSKRVRGGADVLEDYQRIVRSGGGLEQRSPRHGQPAKSRADEKAMEAVGHEASEHL